MIGLRLRAKCLGDSLGRVVHRPVRGMLKVNRTGHHVAAHVTAGREGRGERVIHTGYRRLELALEHTMKLEALTRGHAECAVRVPTSQLVKRQILGGGEEASGQCHPDHEREGLLLVLRASLPPVAIVLLIAAVKLEQLQVIVVEVGRIGGQRLGDGPSQEVPLPLGRLDFRLCARSRRLVLVACWVHPVPSSRQMPLPLLCNPHSVLAVLSQRPARL